jgi:phage-related protein
VVSSIRLLDVSDIHNASFHPEFGSIDILTRSSAGNTILPPGATPVIGLIPAPVHAVSSTVATLVHPLPVHVTATLRRIGRLIIATITSRLVTTLPVGNTIVHPVTTLIKPVVDTIATPVHAVRNTVTTSIKAVVNSVTTLIHSLVSDITAALQAVGQLIFAVITGPVSPVIKILFPAIAPVIQTGIDTVASIIQARINTFTTGIQTGINAVAALVEPILGTLPLLLAGIRRKTQKNGHYTGQSKI